MGAGLPRGADGGCLSSGCLLSLAQNQMSRAEVACLAVCWGCREQIVALRHLGVRLVLTLTEEEPLPAEWFKDTGVRNVFVPTPNYEPPSVEQMDKCMGEACELQHTDHNFCLPASNRCHCGVYA